MKLVSKLFGEINIDNSKIVEFENGIIGIQGTDADIKEGKAPNTTFDNDDSLDLDSEEYDLDGFQ